MSKILVLLLCSSPIALASSPNVSDTKVIVNKIPARPSDVQSIDGLVRAFYEVVSVKPNEARQWDRDRTLYVPWVRFIANSLTPEGKPQINIWNHQQFVESMEPLMKNGFKEWEISRKTRIYGNIAHIDSAYEGEYTENNKTEKFRGVNSLEAYFDGSRWWISSVMWMSESPKYPIPKELLTPAKK